MKTVLRIQFISLMVLIGLTLGACQTTPPAAGASPPTFDQLYQAGVSADDLILKAGNAALNTHLISAAQAHRVLTVTDAVKAVLDAAEVSYKAGNSASATTNLGKATSILAVLSSCLTQTPLTVGSFDACTSALITPTVTP